MVLLNHIQYFPELPYLGAPGGMAPPEKGVTGVKKFGLTRICVLWVLKVSNQVQTKNGQSFPTEAQILNMTVSTIMCDLVCSFLLEVLCFTCVVAYFVIPVLIYAGSCFVLMRLFSIPA